MTVGSDRSATKPPGRVSKALIGLFMKRATVAAIDDVADDFRLVMLEGSALRGVAWTPGQKVQIALGSAFTTRTYTPMDWNAARGHTRILAYAHGGGPGSAWLASLRVGDACDLMGPRGSLDARHLVGPLAVYGDETSIGLAYALAQQDRGRAVASYFEVGDMASGEQVGSALNVEDVTLFARRGDDAHLAEMEATLPALVSAGGSFVLTGKAGTVQRLRQALKRHGVGAERVATKAYWAPGKAGMD